VKLLRQTGSIKRRKGSARSTKRTPEVVDAVEEIMGKKNFIITPVVPSKLNVRLVSCFFFIGSLFCLFKARLSVYNSNFQKRAFFKVSMAT
jgi:hypothetical protein